MFDKQRFNEFFEALNRRDLEHLGSLLADNAEFYFPKTQLMKGKDRILRFFNILFRQYPELSFHLERTIVEGQTAAVHWTNRGVKRKGEPYNNEGITLFKEGPEGRIIFMSDFLKNTENF